MTNRIASLFEIKNMVEMPQEIKNEVQRVADRIANIVIEEIKLSDFDLMKVSAIMTALGKAYVDMNVSMLYAVSHDKKATIEIFDTLEANNRESFIAKVNLISEVSNDK